MCQEGTLLFVTSLGGNLQTPVFVASIAQAWEILSKEELDIDADDYKVYEFRSGTWTVVESFPKKSFEDDLTAFLNGHPLVEKTTNELETSLHVLQHNTLFEFARCMSYTIYDIAFYLAESWSLTAKNPHCTKDQSVKDGYLAQSHVMEKALEEMRNHQTPDVVLSQALCQLNISGLDAASTLAVYTDDNRFRKFWA